MALGLHELGLRLHENAPSEKYNSVKVHFAVFLGEIVEETKRKGRRGWVEFVDKSQIPKI